MRLSLRVVLLVGVLGIQVVTVSAILISSYVATQDALLDHARTLTQDVSNATIRRSEAFLEPARVTADLTRQLVQRNILQIGDFRSVERYFLEQLRLHPSISGIYFGGPDGSFVFVTRNPDSQSQPGSFLTKFIHFVGGKRAVELISRSKDFEALSRRLDPADKFDPRKRPWYRRAAETGGLTWTAPYVFFTSKRPGITLAGALRDSNGAYIGAVGVDIELGGLSSFLRQLHIGESGSAFILSRNGEVIAHPRAPLVRQTGTGATDRPRFLTIGELSDPIAREAVAASGLAPAPIEIDQPLFRSFEHGGQRYLAAFTPFFNENWPWTLVIYVPEDDYLGQLKQSTRNSLYLALAIGAIGCLLSIAIWRTIARPMRQLSQDSASIQEGRLDQPPQTSSVYQEIQAAAAAFRRMAAAVHTREQENARLRRMQAQLVETMRKSGVAQFASAVAHEINNPLAALLTNLQIMTRVQDRSDEAAAERVRKAVADAQDQAGRVADIVRGLRELVETGESERRSEDVNEIVREAVQLVSADDTVDEPAFQFDLVPDLPPALANRVQVQQVLFNLIRNAMEAMATTPKPAIRLSTSLSDDAMIVVEIADNGPGWPEELGHRMFEPWVTTKRSGMGIGLAVCRTIVEAHGGRLTAQSGPDGGAVLTFTLPVAPNETGADV